MSRLIQIVVVIALIGGAGFGGFYYGRHAATGAPAGEEVATTQPAEEEKPVASVKTVTLTRSSISPMRSAMGDVTPAASDLRSVSVPFECRVTRVIAAIDATVAKGDELIEVEASPDVAVALQDSKNTLAITQADLKATEGRLTNHLATNQELSTARAAVQSAELKLKSLTDRGVAEPQQLKAIASGIVSKIDVQQGQIIAAGLPLVELSGDAEPTVQLQIDPADVLALKVDSPVNVSCVDATGDAGVTGKIRSIAQRIDPGTRAIAVTVALPSGTNWRIGCSVLATFAAGTATGWIVPRDAALPGDDGVFELFTVADGKAVHHVVKLGLEDESAVQVIADDLHEGDLVITQGNAEVEDGMAVTTEAATTQPTTEPADTRMTIPATSPATEATTGPAALAVPLPAALRAGAFS